MENDLKPGTLCRIVWVAPPWICALNQIVTIVEVVQLTFETVYKIDRTFVDAAGRRSNHGQRRCFQPISDPNSCDVTERDVYREKELVQ